MLSVTLMLALASSGKAGKIDPDTKDAIPLVAEIARAGYKISFSDEFNGSTLDLEKWKYRVGPRGWSMGKAENVKVENGRLVIDVKKEDTGELHYSAGGIISKERFKYGYYEARFKTPPGGGWHTSFWQMFCHPDEKNTKEAKQELDICEQDSNDHFSYSSGVNDWDGKNRNKNHDGKFPRYYKKRPKTPDTSADFHVWSCEFTPQKIRFFFDGKLTTEGDSTVFEHGDGNIWLTCVSINLNHTKEVDETKLPATAEFDYVRYYEQPK